MRRRQWHPTPVLLPGKSHGWRSLGAAVHGVAESRTRLSDFTFTFHFHALEKEMATHSSVLAWKIPGMAEAGGLPSMGSHRVEHDWSDLAAEAVLLRSKLCLVTPSCTAPWWFSSGSKLELLQSSSCLFSLLLILHGISTWSVTVFVLDYIFKDVCITNIVFPLGQRRDIWPR